MKKPSADKLFKWCAVGAGVLILGVLAAVAVFLLIQASPVFFGEREAAAEAISSFTGGRTSNFWAFVGPLIFGTVLASALALALAFFVAVGIAIFISHYAPKRLASVLSYIVDLLAAIPSVVYGLWGAFVLVPHTYPVWKVINSVLGWIPFFAGPVSNPPRTVATVAVVLAVMILPIITSMARDIFVQTPLLQQEAALALGATKWEMIKLYVLPFGANGLMSASMLGLGRALGETMAVLMILSPGSTYGIQLFTASRNQTIAANIAAQFPEADTIGVSTLIATGLVLFIITFVVNYIARRITHRSSKKATSKKSSGNFAQKAWSRITSSTHQGKVETEKTEQVDGNSEVAAASAQSAPTPDFDKFKPSRSSLAARKRTDWIMRVLIYTAFVIALIPLISVLYTTIVNGAQRFDWYFLTHNMRGVVGGLYPYGGILHAAVGTLEITLGAIIISVPIGVMTAVYLVEYSAKKHLHRAISFLVDVMSGIPSIVAGLFAYAMFSLILGPGTMNGFVGSVALSILMIPTIVRTTEEMLSIVPVDLREASYALGVSKSRTIVKIVLRTALPGIVSGIILAIARVIGETAPLLVTAGAISSTNFNLFSGRMTTLPVYVYNEFQQGVASCPAMSKFGSDSVGVCVPGIRMERAWAAALVLIVVVLILNAIGRLVARVFAVKTK